MSTGTAARVLRGELIIDWRHEAEPALLSRAANAGTAKALFAKRGPDVLALPGERQGIVLRPAAQVVGIMFHITACLFGVTPAAVKSAGGDQRLARNRRARRIPAHATVFRDGDAVVPWPLRSHLYHGNAGNLTTLGVEIESKDGTITDEQRATLADLVPWLIVQASKEGMVLHEAWAHRQTHGGKPNDPGPIVWREVVIPLAEKHGLTRTIKALPRSTPKGRDGAVIPKTWDPLGV